jgi:hypothetical protein
MTDEELAKAVNELIRVESLEEIAGLPLETEAVFVSRPDDAKVEILSKLTNLRRLIQDGNSLISDAGMKVLGHMYSLEELDLEWSENITDAGLAELQGLRSLRWLDVGFCRGITERGVTSLQESLPSCEIVA